MPIPTPEPPVNVKPYPIDFIRGRVERQARENYIYDSVETATADRAELLEWFDTERTLHNAWRKRAEEAEALLPASATRQALCSKCDGIGAYLEYGSIVKCDQCRA